MPANVTLPVVPVPPVPAVIKMACPKLFELTGSGLGEDVVIATWLSSNVPSGRNMAIGAFDSRV